MSRSGTVRCVDARALDRDVEGAARAHQRVLADLDAAVDLDPTRSSLLPGWTVGHVITHLARQADSVVRLLDGAEQYPGGPATRAAEIDAGAGRDREALITDLRMSIWRLESRWAAHSTWEAEAATVTGAVVPHHELPFRRWREVAIHHVDLGIGYSFEELPGEYVRLELRRMEMLWNARAPMGLTGLPAAALALTSPQRLAWLMGRAEVPGLDPANIY